MYLTYSRYTELNGELAEPAFNRFERLARVKIDARTFERIKKEFDGTQDYAERLEYLMFELISMASVNDVSGEAFFVSSQSNDGVKESYERLAADNSEYERIENGLIVKFLLGYVDGYGTPLIFRGI